MRKQVTVPTPPQRLVDIGASGASDPDQDMLEEVTKKKERGGLG